MRSGSLSVSTRRAFVGLVLVALLCGASGMRAQQAAGQQPPAGQQQAPASQAPAADQFMFTTEAGQVIFQVKPDKTADFESAWTEIKTKTSAAEKADWKALGESISLWKVHGTPEGQPAVYVLQINPASKTLSYDPTKILFATKEQGGLWERKDADVVFKKIADAITGGLSMLPLAKITK